MAQTTTAMSFAAANIGFSNDGSSWTDASGYAGMVQVEGGERVTGAAYTADGDTAIIKAGKRGPLTVRARIVYTEAADEGYDDANDAYEAGSAFYLRWSPGGGASGDLGYTTSAGYIKQPVYPSGDVESGDPITVEVVLECASVTESTVGTAGW